MIHIGDITPSVMNAAKSAPRHLSNSQREERRAAMARMDRDLDRLFAETRRLSGGQRRPQPSRQTPRTGYQGFRDAFQAAGLRQALHRGVQGAKSAPTEAFGEDFALMFDAAIEIAVINHQERNTR